MVAGTQVTFDNIPAACAHLHQEYQVSVMVPYEITGRATTSMVVSYNGAASAPLQLVVVNAAVVSTPLTRAGTGQGAILNQSGTVNGPSNPEAAGNIIQIFATGEGADFHRPASMAGSLRAGFRFRRRVFQALR